MNQELIPYNTINQMVDTWQSCQAKIYKAFELLEEAERFAKIAFSEYASIKLDKCYGLEKEEADKVIKEFKRRAWKSIVDKTEIKRFLSVQRAKIIEKELEKEDLPDLTQEEILKLLRSACANIQNFADESVLEVFEILRPRGDYKNNQKFACEIGKKVVLGYKVERKWSGKGFRVAHYSENDMRAIDNVFHALDGQGFSASYYGELHDAIDNSENGVGETKYFKFRCFKNRNLHLEFKRMDLVKKINAIATKNILKPNN